MPCKYHGYHLSLALFKRGEGILLSPHPLIVSLLYRMDTPESNPQKVIRLNLPPSILIKTMSSLLRPSWSVGL